ncbi:MAG: ATP-binding protein [Deltaproteobacteria bacterium]|nr:ATP-binding protein [Deltaproteobacteria bacterium]
MKRGLADVMDAWLQDSGRRPMVLRGARQVGKTWLVRDLAARSGRDLVELNFERDPSLKRHFATNDPRNILAELSLASGRDIHPETAILFLDEIQAASPLLAKLRWFYEELPALPVVAAGSLLEFALAAPTFSVPVGRIGFRHVEPMGFAEYLEAHGAQRLLSTLREWRPGKEPSPAAHEKATEWFHRYAMVGGMPAAVKADVEGRPPREVRELQRELVATYRADFARYSGRMDRDILDSVLRAVAASLGRKFVYAHVGEGVKQQQAKRGLDLLVQARLVHEVRHTAANGLPLGAEVKDGRRKAVLADVALLHALVGTPAGTAFPAETALAPALRGQLAEQLAAQQLRLFHDGAADGPELFYWQREGSSPGEIDYLVQLGGRIVPLELKSGAAGAMKSLHQFVHDKRLGLAVRCDANPPSHQVVDVKTTRGDRVTYRLLGVPPYLLHRVPALLEE